MICGVSLVMKYQNEFRRNDEKLQISGLFDEKPDSTSDWILLQSSSKWE